MLEVLFPCQDGLWLFCVKLLFSFVFSPKRKKKTKNDQCFVSGKKVGILNWHGFSFF